MNDRSCPRHGRGDLNIPGPSVDGTQPAKNHGEIRCDCLETLLSALAPLKMGKWVASACGGNLNVEHDANVALHEAIVAAYHLGLRGGVDPKCVRTCERCRKPFLTIQFHNQALTAEEIARLYEAGSRSCLSCSVETGEVAP